MSLFKQLLQLYVLVAYVVMGFVAYKCYDQYQREVAYASKVAKAFEKPSRHNFWGLKKSTVNDDKLLFKFRDELYIAQLQQEVVIALLLAPLSLPYYLIVKEGRLPSY